MNQTVDPNLRTDDFDYDLPAELIAQEPLAARDSSRLMVVDRSEQSIAHSDFRSLPNFLEAGDLVVANNTRVMKARLFARREHTGGKIELLLLERTRDGRWKSLARPAKRLKNGDRLIVDESHESGFPTITLTIVSKSNDGIIDISPDPDVDLGSLQSGLAPLPPYITTQLGNPERYQTVFATETGSAAAPTAGLHVTDTTICDLEALGVRWAEVTLHIGLDTFRPVTEDHVRDHQIHSEWCTVPEDTAAKVEEAIRNGKRIVALGTTAARTLETAGQRWRDSRASEFETRTSIFITPGYEWTMTSGLLTNFHLPKSTLLMMVSSFAGKELISQAYQEAIDRRYRFYSFGDAMLIL